MKGDDCIQRIRWGMVVHDCNTVSVGGQESPGTQGQPRLHSKTLSQQQGQNKSQVSYQLQAPDLTDFSFTNTKNCLFLRNSAGPRGQRNKPTKQHSLLWGRLHFDSRRQTINKLGNPLSKANEEY